MSTIEIQETVFEVDVFDTIIEAEFGVPGTGGVDSINGLKGVVSLTASDVGADAAGAADAEATARTAALSTEAASRIASDALLAPTAQVVALLGNHSGWALGTNTDVYLPAPTISGGTATGGVLRQVTGVQVVKNYTQTAAPTDTAIGSPFYSSWTATLSDSGSGVGPAPQNGFFGPRGVFQSEGLLTFAHDQTVLNATAITFCDQLMVKNDAGHARSITPGWGFLSCRIFRADGATLKLNHNDTTHGGAAFIDNALYFSENSGAIDGSTTNFDLVSFTSNVNVLGSSHIANRIAFDVHDLNAASGQGIYTPYTDATETSILRGGFPNMDDPSVTVDTQYGLRIFNLTRATRNIGISNASATVEPALAVSITAVGNTLPINTTTLAVTASSDLTLTSTPTIPVGVDGQRIRVVNVGTHTLGLQDEAALSGSNLLVSSLNGSVQLRQNESIDLFYSGTVGKWLKQSVSKPFSTLGGALTAWDGTAAHGSVMLAATSVFGAPLAGVTVFATQGDTGEVAGLISLNGVGVLQLGPGGTTAPDVTLTRTGTAAATWVGRLTMPSPILTGSPTATGGSFNVSDGTAAHGAVTLSATSVLGAQLSGVSVVSTQGDTGAVAGLISLNGVGVLQLGPGGTTTPDVTLMRTGSVAATFTGQLTLATGLTMTDAKNIALGSTTGTQLGTATSQKLGLWGATPVVQPTGSTDVLTGLINIGARASGANPPFNIGTGALTAGAAALSGAITATGATATFTSTVANQTGQVLVNISNISTFPLTSIGVYKAAGDAQATLGLIDANGVSALNFGTGGSNAADAAIARSGANGSAVLTVTGQFTIGTGLTFADAKNIAVNTTTGTKIGTATSQKLGFWNATPIVQPASANQAAVGTTAPAGGTGTAAGGWDTAGHRDTAISTINAAVTLVNQMRSDLVAAGLLKGSA